ncbi:uncharacterized protein LOC134531334 [Bacillus rossius redtenbacheri]|uniref:uncharacterized protein LOC134531334 n=1 Tax=Bacillus rossius redtenbacheri TaxID=93214 RepID=UPI002FDE22D0
MFTYCRLHKPCEHLPARCTCKECYKERCDLQYKIELSSDEDSWDGGKFNFVPETYKLPDKDHEVPKLSPEVAAESNGVPVDFTLPDKDGCKHLLGSCCPVKANQTARYHLHVSTPPVLVQPRSCIH